MKITYASIGILINEKNEILLEKNLTNAVFKGLWQFPGGKLEHGESPYMALLRELKEELGITIQKEHTTILSFNEYPLNETSYYVVFFYICKKWDGDLLNMENKELKWCSLSLLETLPTLPNNKVIIKKLFSHLDN